MYFKQATTRCVKESENTRTFLKGGNLNENARFYGQLAEHGVHGVAGPDSQFLDARKVGLAESGRDEHIRGGQAVVEPIDGRQAELATVRHVERARRDGHEEARDELGQVARENGVRGERQHANERHVAGDLVRLAPG